MRRYLTPSMIVAATLSLPLTAFAQDACPPGAWFCQADDAATSRGAAPEAEAIPPPPPAADLPVPEEQAVAPSREGRMPPPPVVVYQPQQTSTPRTQIIIIAPGRTHVVRKAPPPHVRRAPVVVHRTRVRTTTVTPVVRTVQTRWKSEWGLNARLQGIGFGGDHRGEMATARDAGMGGFGISLRYRPWARLALDAGIDVIGGTDLNGFERVETPFSLNGIFYFNPRSRSQFYVIGGVNWSRATVSSDEPSPLLTAGKNGNDFSADYKYFGGQLGAGLEFRLSKRLSFNVDVLGFVRSRTDIEDDHHKMRDGDTTNVAEKPAEYINPVTGQTTNTSGGGLFRGGLTLWW